MKEREIGRRKREQRIGEKRKGVDRETRMDRTERNKSHRSRKWEKEEGSNPAESSHLISVLRAQSLWESLGPTLFLPLTGYGKLLTLILL